MINQTSGVRSTLIALIQSPNTGLRTIAVCANAIAADALFNLWIGTVAKNEATEERMVELVEFYDRMERICLAKLSNNVLAADALEKFVLEMTRQLEDAMR